MSKHSQMWTLYHKMLLMVCKMLFPTFFSWRNHLVYLPSSMLLATLIHLSSNNEHKYWNMCLKQYDNLGGELKRKSMLSCNNSSKHALHCMVVYWICQWVQVQVLMLQNKVKERTHFWFWCIWRNTHGAIGCFIPKFACWSNQCISNTLKTLLKYWSKFWGCSSKARAQICGHRFIQF